MSYTPINIPAYVASYSGAVAGMGVSGWIIDPAQSQYDAITKIAGAFAEAFDTAWNDATQLNNLEIASITSIVSTEFQQRGPGPLANPVFQTVNNWDIPARACIALVLESDAFFAGQGINPGTPGGGGGTVLQLSNVIYADRQGSGAAPDGSIANPYVTLQAAVAAAAALGIEVTKCTILMTPWDYTGFGDLDLPVTPEIAFIGLDTKLIAQLPDVHCPAATCQFENCNVGSLNGVSDTSAGGGVEFFFKNASAVGVQGNNSYLYASGLCNTPQGNDFLGQISGLTGTFASIALDGYAVIASSSIVQAFNLNLSNQSAVVCQEWQGRYFGLENSSFNGIITGDGNGQGKCINGLIGQGSMTGFTDTTDPFVFLNTQIFGLNINCPDGAIAMDAATQQYFGTAQFANPASQTTGIIDSATAGEQSFRTFADADITFNMSIPNHIVIGEATVTAPRVIKLNTTNGVLHQVFTIDNYGQANNVTIEKSLDNSTLYQFTNGPGTVYRAKFRITNAGGNDFELFSLERLQ